MSGLGKTKICFVIAPIGKDDSEIRQRSDQILNHIIIPVVKDCGYETIRADKISEPGIITSQIIQHVDNPISLVIDLEALRQSKNSLEKSNAKIISLLQGMNFKIDKLDSSHRSKILNPKFTPIEPI